LVTAGFIAGRSVSNAAQLRDLAAAASRLFGWDTKQPQTQINQLCISTEQLQQIRALRGTGRRSGTKHRSYSKKGKQMSVENVTTALQVNTTTGEGFSLFLPEPRFVAFRIVGNGSVSAGAVTIELVD